MGKGAEMNGRKGNRQRDSAEPKVGRRYKGRCIYLGRGEIGHKENGNGKEERVVLKVTESE